MFDQIKEVKADIGNFSTELAEELEQFRIKYLGSKGIIKDLFKGMKEVAPEDRKAFGLEMNALKNLATEKYETLKAGLNSSGVGEGHQAQDLSLPVHGMPNGSRHPLSLIREEIIDIFGKIGYVVSEGPEIEDDWHNFTALNFPEEHPARDMQDTFFIDTEHALRTHTSSVQVRVMESSQPPIRTISPGRVFRNEAISARAHCIFHQVEGLYIDKGVSFADLKQNLFYFAREMFGEKTEIRFRPSYFPFTEPSAEMDISCNICGGKGCNVCKYTGYVEILGCGMVDPNVLENCGIDSKTYSGFAFGMGIERIAMLKYRINDLRLFFENDQRFLNQFKSAH